MKKGKTEQRIKVTETNLLPWFTVCRLLSFRNGEFDVYGIGAMLLFLSEAFMCMNSMPERAFKNPGRSVDLGSTSNFIYFQLSERLCVFAAFGDQNPKNGDLHSIMDL